MSLHRLTFLGCGGALRFRSYYGLPKLFNTNILIETKDETGRERVWLIDVGHTAGEALEHLSTKRSARGENPIDLISVTDMVITHMHSDHAGGVEEKAFLDMFVAPAILPDKEKCRLYGKKEFLEKFWAQSLSGGLEVVDNRKVGLDHYFEVVEVPGDGRLQTGPDFEIGDLKVTLYPNLHMGLNGNSEFESWGMMIEDEKGRKIFYTGDTMANYSHFASAYNEADVIFHDCELADYPDSIHAQFRQLCEYPEDVRRKMWLVHYSVYYKDPAWGQRIEEAGFHGFWPQQKTVSFEELFSM